MSKDREAAKAKKQRVAIIKESKMLCEELRDKEFYCITKVELAVVIRNLVLEFHRKDETIKKLQEQLETYTKKEGKEG